MTTLSRPARKPGGSAPKRKGDRTERLVVSILQAAGFAAERSLRPGATPGRRAAPHDIGVPFLGVDRRVEVKCRADGFASLYRWLKPNFAVVIKRDRAEPLVVLRLQDALDIAIIAEKARDA